jgi:hypothetical protein
MVLRMSISSVPGTSSDFFASFPIDYLSIDKVWEKVSGFASPVKSPNCITKILNAQPSPPTANDWSQAE